MGHTMELTPLDIRYQEFRLGLRGYAQAEVREYLAKVAERLTEVQQQNEALKSRVRQVEEELAHAKEGEADLKRAVVAAERIARDIKTQAERDIELLRREAEADRQKALQDVIEHMKKLRVEIDQLKQERDMFVAQFRSMLEGYLSSLERYKH